MRLGKNHNFAYIECLKCRLSCRWAGEDCLFDLGVAVLETAGCLSVWFSYDFKHIANMLHEQSVGNESKCDPYNILFKKLICSVNMHSVQIQLSPVHLPATSTTY